MGKIAEKTGREIVAEQARNRVEEKEEKKKRVQFGGEKPFE